MMHNQNPLASFIAIVAVCLYIILGQASLHQNMYSFIILYSISRPKIEAKPVARISSQKRRSRAAGIRDA